MEFAKQPHPDRLHIDVEDAEELHALAKHLGVSPEEIISAVEKVGDSIDTVRKELGIPEEPAEP